MIHQQEQKALLTAEDAAKIDIKALHTAGEWIVDKEATEEEAGSKHKECTVCGHVMEEAVIDKLTPSTPDPEPTPGNTDNNQPAAPEAEKPAAEGSSPNTVVMMMSLMVAAMLGAAYVLFAQARSRKRS